MKVFTIYNQKFVKPARQKNLYASISIHHISKIRDDSSLKIYEINREQYKRSYNILTAARPQQNIQVTTLWSVKYWRKSSIVLAIPMWKNKHILLEVPIGFQKQM